LSRLEKEELLTRVVEALQESGWDVIVTKDSHPFELTVSHDNVTEKIRVYIWNITHGGGAARAADEYRIQLTGVDRNRIETGTTFRTLLLGWDSRHKVFAGWNASRYEAFGFSPSLQVKDGTLANAENQGLAMQPKATDSQGNVTEVVVAFRPELLGAYVSNLDKYHQPQLTRAEAELLERVATARPPTDTELAALSEERRHVIREVEQAVRNGRFRKIVMDAYDKCCAVCNLDFGIVHAAHIVPIDEQGTDEATNGIVLCANHHAAFDRDLLIITEDYIAKVNYAKVKKSELGILLEKEHKIRLPSDSRLQPNPAYLRERIRKHNLQLI